jgi:hypothetical protein
VPASATAHSTLEDFGIENVNRPSRPAPGLLGLDCSDCTGTRDWVKVRVEGCSSLLDALRDGLVDRIGTAERRARHGVAAHPYQELELSFADFVAGRDLAGPESWEPAAHPPARWRALRVVVAGQRRRQ